jgi:DNA-binding HxlR family transcriptional regulator
MKSYGQRCPLARALDVIGDRWTLLIVRELLLGPRRYTDLFDGLPGIGTNILAGRLEDLQAAHFHHPPQSACMSSQRPDASFPPASAR